MNFQSLRAVFRFTLSVILAVLLLQLSVHPFPNPINGFVKLLDPPGQNIIFSQLENNLQLAFLEPGLRVVIGVIEVGLAVLIIIPFTRSIAAVIITALFAAMTALHLTPVLGTHLPLKTGSENIVDDGGANFMLHILILCLAMLVTAIPRETHE